MSRDNEIGLGQFAEQMLVNPAYLAAFERVKKNLFDEFEQSGILQKRKREAIHKKIQAVNAVQREIDQMVQRGKFLQQEENRREKLSTLKGL